MFRQVCTLALVVLAALGSLTLATAQESKLPGGTTKSPPKEFAVDLGGGGAVLGLNPNSSDFYLYGTFYPVSLPAGSTSVTGGGLGSGMLSKQRRTH